MKHVSATVALAAGLVVGCGSSDPDPAESVDRADPKAVAQEYADALRSEEGSAACDLVEPVLREPCHADPDGFIEGGAQIDNLGKVTKVDLNGSAAKRASTEEGSWT